MQWAHSASLAAPLRKIMSPFEEVGSISAGTAHIINMGQIDTIGRISLDFEMGPLMVPIHFYSMGPCGLFRLQRSNCTWVLPTTTTKVFDIMCCLYNSSMEPFCAHLNSLQWPLHPVLEDGGG